MPSRYRSVFACGTGAGCAAVPAASVTATGGAAGDCPEALVVRNVTDANAQAREVLMNARGIGT